MKFVLTKILTLFVGCIFLSCSGGGEETRTAGGDTDQPVKPIVMPKPSVNLYIETSGSVKGFLSGSSEYKNNVYQLLNTLDSKQSKLAGLNVFLIPNGPHTSKDVIATDVVTIKNKIMNLKMEWGAETSFQGIFSEINKRSNPNAVDIFITDNVMSYSNKSSQIKANCNANKDNATLLASDIQTVFSEIDGQGKVATLEGYHSVYKGSYYTYKCSKSGQSVIPKYSDAQRPYYFWVFGKKENTNFVRDLYRSQLPNKSVEEAHYGFEPTNKAESLLRFYNKGLDADSRGDYTFMIAEGSVHNVNAKNGLMGITFSMAVNLSEFPNELIQNAIKENLFTVNATGIETEIFSVEAVKDIQSKLHNKDLDVVNKIGATHVVTLRLKKYKSDMQFSLGIGTPQQSWVQAWTTMDDTDKANLSGKTFALKPLADAAQRAFNGDTEQFYQGKQFTFKLD